MPTASELITKIEVQGVDAYARDMRKAEDVTDKTAKNMDTAGKQASGLSSALGLGVKAAAGVTLGIGALGGVVGKVGFDFNSMQQQSQIAFETILGDAQKARDFMGQIGEFAKKTPFELGPLTQYASRLAAVGTETDRIIPLMTQLGNATSGMGTSAEGISRAVTALTQMQQKGKVTGEEMLQLTEAGIPAWESLAAVLGTDVATAQKKVTDGQVAANKIFEAIETGAGPAFQRLNGMMDKQSQSFSGLISTAKDSFAQFAGTISGPVFEMATKGLKGLTDAMATPAFAEFGQRTGQAIADVLSRIGRFAAEAGPQLVSAFQEAGPVIREVVSAFADFATNDILPKLEQLGSVIRDTVLPAVKGLGGISFDALSTAIAFLADNKEILGGFAIAIGAVATAWGVYTVAQAAANIVMLANPIGALVIALGLLATGIIYVVKNWDEITQKFPIAGQIVDEIVVSFKNFTEWLGKAAQAIIDANFGEKIEAAFKWLVDFNLAEKAAEWFGGLWEGMQQKWDEGVSFLTNLGTSILDAIGDVTSTLWQKGQDLIAGLARGYVELWTSEINFFVNLGTTIFGAIGDVVSTLWQKGQDLVAGLWRGVSEFWTLTVVPFWTGLAAAVVGHVGIVLETLLQKGKDLIQGLWNGITEIWKTVSGFFTGLKDTIIRLIGPPLEWLRQMGKDLIQGFINGVNDMWDGAVRFAGNLFDAVIGGVKSVLGINSPSTVMAGMGKDFIQGFIDGTGSMAGALKEFVTGLVGGAVSAAREAAGGIAGAVAGAPSALAGAIGVGGGGGGGDWAGVAAQAANMVGLPVDLIQAMAYHESGGGNLYAEGDGGTSHGLFQVHTPAHPSLPREAVIGPEGALRAAREMQGRWVSAFSQLGGQAAFDADPVGFYMRFQPLAQGSVAISRQNAETAIAAARRYAAGGTVDPGWFTVGERGFELGHLGPEGLQIFPHEMSKALIGNPGGMTGYQGGSNTKAEMFAAAVASPGGWTPALAQAWFEGMEQIAKGMEEETREMAAVSEEVYRRLMRQAAQFSTELGTEANKLYTEFAAGLLSAGDLIAELRALLGSRRGRMGATGAIEPQSAYTAPMQVILQVNGQQLAQAITPAIAGEIAMTVQSTSGAY